MLRIRNSALLDEVSLDFEPGLLSVTVGADAGAGKYPHGALSLLAGERADKPSARGALACEVDELVFPRGQKIDALLAELDLPLCEDYPLLLKRSLRATACRSSPSTAKPRHAGGVAASRRPVDRFSRPEPNRGGCQLRTASSSCSICSGGRAAGWQHIRKATVRGANYRRQPGRRNQTCA